MKQNKVNQKTKKNLARKTAEMQKAKKKQVRMSKMASSNVSPVTKKGKVKPKSSIGQSKKSKK